MIKARLEKKNNKHLTNISGITDIKILELVITSRNSI
jgi:hypothetical protein